MQCTRRGLYILPAYHIQSQTKEQSPACQPRRESRQDGRFLLRLYGVSFRSRGKNFLHSDGLASEPTLAQIMETGWFSGCGVAPGVRVPVTSGTVVRIVWNAL